MKRRIIFGVLLLCFFAAPVVFAQTNNTDPIRNNHFYLESVRMVGLAHTAYSEGDYDAARQYAEDALRYARLSDEYIAMLLESNRSSPLPAQFTVRTWQTYRDCLWNIAGMAAVYGDPTQWRRLYDANRSRFPDPNNPNLILPGMVLDIPSIRGEGREGMWAADRSYVTLPTLPR
jgi:hypothetical protein